MLAIVGFVFIGFGAFVDSSTVEKSIDANTWSAIGYAVMTLSFLAAIVVVSSINHMQRQRDAEAAVGHEVDEPHELLATIGGAIES